MKVITVRSWNGFVRIVEKLREQYGTHTLRLKDGKEFSQNVRILFRGQSDSRWTLSTTLERHSNDTFTVQNYYLKLAKIVNELESYSGRDWEFPRWPQLIDQIEKNQDSFRVELPAYHFLIYLRHHGFPSSLLDWTESPYIACYFAFISALTRNPAVYCYIETPEMSKTGWGGAPRIDVRGPYVRTHTRHFAQKAWYTIASQWDEEQKKHTFCRHDLVLSQYNKHQDLLFRIVIPRSLRTKILARLSDYNINHYTLFATEEALVKSLVSKVFDLDEA